MLDNSFVFEGRTAHGSTPENGDNAIKKMLAFLVEIGEFNLLDYDNLFGTAIDFSQVTQTECIIAIMQILTNPLRHPKNIRMQLNI